MTKKATTKKATTKAKKLSPDKAVEVVNTPPIDRDAEIANALDDLRAAASSGAKKAIRRRLRSLGHTGGLGVKGIAKGE